jgi:hypothetical protein
VFLRRVESCLEVVPAGRASLLSGGNSPKLRPATSPSGLLWELGRWDGMVPFAWPTPGPMAPACSDGRAALSGARGASVAADRRVAGSQVGAAAGADGELGADLAERWWRAWGVVRRV